ncbi:MAG: AAA family ATPase [Burkholderiales bacterium]|nr:AAA family ATPase [Burkholderiales bacterium]
MPATTSDAAARGTFGRRRIAGTREAPPPPHVSRPLRAERAPFRITPHTDFFFAGANRGATLEALLYAIGHEEGIIKITGEVGSGKTMLCRVLIERLPKHIETIYLANPSLSRDEILHTIADDLRVSVEGRRTTVLLRALQEDLIRRYAAGKRVVVLIDEAHAMPLETLEEIRLLSNLESNRHKLLHIVLFGQPELDQHLALPHMRQIKERIIHSFRLEPLVRDDVAQYIEFRMRAAGYRGPSVFTPAALRLIAQASQGLTRRVNILADKSLLAAFAEGTHQITVKQARAAVRDAEFKPSRRPSGAWWVAGAGLTVGLAIGLAVHLYRSLTPSGTAPQTHARAIGPGSSNAHERRADAAPSAAAAAQPPAPAANAASATPAATAVSPAPSAAPPPAAAGPAAAASEQQGPAATASPPAAAPAPPTTAEPAVPSPPPAAAADETEHAAATVAAGAPAPRAPAAQPRAAPPRSRGCSRTERGPASAGDGRARAPALRRNPGMAQDRAAAALRHRAPDGQRHERRYPRRPARPGRPPAVDRRGPRLQREARRPPVLRARLRQLSVGRRHDHRDGTAARDPQGPHALPPQLRKDADPESAIVLTWNRH